MADVETSIIEPARILLADDDPIMRELASAKLAAAGHDVASFADGGAAFEALARDGADLVISDLDMPVMDGFELTRRIRASDEWQDVPVIVVTGSDHASAVEAAFAAGATSFLAKPINWTLFSQSVMFVLRASRDQHALRAARDQAEAGAKFKDSLMSVMSHELRTPLNAIIGFGQILSEQFERENDNLHKEYADYIIDGGRRLLNSVSDMLLASDARTGPIVINEKACTVGEIVDLACAAAGKAASAGNIELSVALENPEQELCGDRGLIARALGKLIDNALKFSGPGARVVVGTTLTKSGGLAFLVQDTGPGMAPERLAALVQPFAQSDMSLHRSKEGLGLGIPLVHAIAAAHEASFRLDSTPGEGTRALIVLPPERISGRPRAVAAAG
ncbi:MAG: response regulator [Pseudomonadota bacterium]|nr:response regulator [Pseudomonadota bacterium]